MEYKEILFAFVAEYLSHYLNYRTVYSIFLKDINLL
jgi:hypothetical protein